MTTTLDPQQTAPEGLRERREAESALDGLRSRFRSPTPPEPRDWPAMRGEVRRLSGLLSAFLAFEEGPDDWPEALVSEVPRMSGRGEALRRERAQLRSEASRLSRDASLSGASDPLGYAQLRARFARLDARLRRHFEEIRSLVQDSYCDDIGAGD